MKQLATLLMLFTVTCLLAQSPKYRVVSVPVKTGSGQLRFPWTGGMNAPQFSMCDLDNDGVKDLFVFDRVGNSVLTYLNLGNNSDTTFQYAPEYESLFPRDLEHWALIRDYNNDGIPDIFSRAIFYNGESYLGSRVHKGKIVNGQLAFDVVKPVLSYTDLPYEVNIWTNIDDVPAYVDVNGDGDLDILTFGIFGTGVEYYENQAVENPGNPAYSIDSFKYLEYSTCWGNFAEASLNNSLVLGLSCKGGKSLPEDGGGNRHMGSTIYSFDADNDHDVDLLLGDISYSNLVFAHNCGDSSFANVCDWDSLWPSCNVPAVLPIFPGAYGVDADNDGREDVIAAPNARQGALDNHNAFLYRNVADTGCQFSYQTDTFLVQHSLDFGTNSKPVLFDFNGDGLKDLIVGNYGYFRPFSTYKSTLAVFENTGTTTNPRFELITDDYKNYSTLNLVAMHPAFGDLDGDGKEDLLAGDLTGYLNFFKNTGTTQANFAASPTTAQYFGIDVGQYAAPFIYDVNGDQLNDLVVGKRDGKISYFWNFGTQNAPQFSPDSVNTFFGNVKVNRYGYVDGFATPIITKDSANNLLLYSGSERGSIYKYLINPANLRSGAFQLIDSNYLGFPVGVESALTMGDLNNDGKLEYIIGNARGGLMMYSDSLWDTSTLPLAVNDINTDEARMFLYPNPATNYVTCEVTGMDLNKPAVEVYGLLGQKETVPVTLNGNKLGINTETLSAGMYFIRVSNKGKIFTDKFLVK